LAAGDLDEIRTHREDLLGRLLDAHFLPAVERIRRVAPHASERAPRQPDERARKSGAHPLALDRPEDLRDAQRLFHGESLQATVDSRQEEHRSAHRPSVPLSTVDCRLSTRFFYGTTLILPWSMFMPHENGNSPSRCGMTSMAVLECGGRAWRIPNSGRTTSSEQGLVSRRSKTSLSGIPFLATIVSGL